MKNIILLTLLCLALCIDNGLGKTPPMGWNSWNHFGCKINQTLIKMTADIIVSSGLAEKGYTYLNLDDCWQASRNPQTNQIEPDFTRFPSGMKSLADYVHSKGLKFGLYSDAGTQTCQGRPGSYNYQELDAKTYAAWGVDYLKYDNCHNQIIPAQYRYPIMSQALLKSGRPIFFSMCQWGRKKVWEWAGPLANSWRTTMDIKDHWESIMLILGDQAGLSKYAGPGGWNDPDMLEVGNGRLSHDQYQAHFALWAILKAPLLIGCDVSKMSDSTKQILMNEQVIALNQDKLGIAADLIMKTRTHQIWGGRLTGNRFIVAFLNRQLLSQSQTFDLKQIIGPLRATDIRDPIRHKSLQVPADGRIYIKAQKKHSVQLRVVSYGDLEEQDTQMRTE